MGLIVTVNEPVACWRQNQYLSDKVVEQKCNFWECKMLNVENKSYSVTSYRVLYRLVICSFYVFEQYLAG